MDRLTSVGVLEVHSEGPVIPRDGPESVQGLDPGSTTVSQ